MKKVEIDGYVVVVTLDNGERVREQSVTAVLLAEILKELQSVPRAAPGLNFLSSGRNTV